jgi:hypothetical protein
MICPKCGQEYEGKICPKCSEPEIVVNNSDYLMRKKAYEEKQAGKKPDFLKEEATPTVENADEVINKIRDKSVQIAASKMDEIHSKIKTRRPEKKTKNPAAFIRKHKILLIIVAVALIVAIASGFSIYQLFLRKNYVLYMSSNDKIYNVSNLESKYVCDVSNAVFQVDGETFYTPVFPSDIDRSEVIQTLASDSGKYFTAVTYDEDSDKYTLYLWNDNGCCKVSENKKQKSVKYVTDKGKVVYTDTDIVNYEDGFGGMELYVYDVSTTKTDSVLNGTLTLIESKLRSVNIYSEKDLLVCLNNDNSLYTYDYSKMSGKTILADNVRSVYAMTADNDYVFSNKATEVNQSKSANSFIYNMNGVCYYHVLGDKPESDMNLGKSTGSAMEFIYDKSGGYLYMASAGNFSCAQVSSGQVAGFTTVDTLGTASDAICFSNNSQILFVNASGKLNLVSKGNEKELAEGVSDGTLSSVRNTTNAFTYIQGTTQYYCSSISAKAVKMMDTSGILSTSETIYYKNNLYFYSSDGKLYSCSDKGKDDNEVGTVDKFWLGTEYK